MLSDSIILKKIGRQPRQTAGYKQLVRELGLHGDARKELLGRLQKMTARGELTQIDSDRYAIPRADSGKNLVAGKLSLHRDGFGFVTPDQTRETADPGLSVSRSVRARIAGDIFIPPHAVGSAMHGDRVLVEVTEIRYDNKAEGRILRTVHRAHPSVVGIFHYGRRENHVVPIDQRVSREILIPQGMEYPEIEGPPVHAGRSPSPASDRGESAKRRGPAGEGPDLDGRLRPAGGASRGAGSRHRVLGGEAARRADWQDLDQVVVDVEITDWPTSTQNPRGRVIEILGYEDDFGVDVEIAIRKYHLPHRFPDAVLHDAERIEPIISSAELHRRRDFRDLPIVTIDGETARDFDDAVLVRRLENGNFELEVHIADVAQYVKEGSALDQEARLRGTSVYFPDRAVPMLPLELSTDICSLRPHVDRLVMSCIMEIDNAGDVVGYEICPGVIRSAERMTYTEVNAILEGDESARRRHANLAAGFERMRELETILNRKRQRRGSIDFDLPEPVIEFDEFGLMKSIARSERNIAHRIIEEFMLAANECVAGYLEAEGIPSLYRIHEKPDGKRVYDFEVIAATFGYSLGVGALPIQRMRPKTDRRASQGTGRRTPQIEIPREVHITPRMYQKLAEKIAGKPEERILSYLMLRSLKQARYSEENLGHFALAASTYTHFTSPIRRYPDLIVHRILKQVLENSGDGIEARVSARSSVPAAEVREPSARAPRAKDSPSPWTKRRPMQPAGLPARLEDGPIAIDELHAIAEESSQTERRADDAERELMEWKKAKFMQDRIGEDFEGLIISVTKYGFFVELTDLFVEGLVPLATLTDDFYTYRENTREILGHRSRRVFRLGQQVRVLVDRIDPVEKKIQFALLEEKQTGKKQTGKKKRK